MDAADLMPGGGTVQSLCAARVRLWPPPGHSGASAWGRPRPFLSPCPPGRAATLFQKVRGPATPAEAGSTPLGKDSLHPDRVLVFPVTDSPRATGHAPLRALPGHSARGCPADCTLRLVFHGGDSIVSGKGTGLKVTGSAVNDVLVSSRTGRASFFAVYKEVRFILLFVFLWHLMMHKLWTLTAADGGDGVVFLL